MISLNKGKENINNLGQTVMFENNPLQTVLIMIDILLIVREAPLQACIMWQMSTCYNQCGSPSTLNVHYVDL